MSEKLTLSNELVQAIGDYLITRPYKEVAMLIAGLQQEVQASVAAKPNGMAKTEPDEASVSPGDLQ